MVFSLKNVLLLCALASAAMLTAAFIAQYGFGLHPCHLCILQRYPYAAVIFIGAAGAYVPALQPYGKKLLWLCVALFWVDSGIAFYHAGVELGWFPGPSGCTNSQGAGATLEELREQIKNAVLVPCDQAMAHIFGLSLAAWNGLAAFTFAALTLVGIRKSS